MDSGYTILGVSNKIRRIHISYFVSDRAEWDMKQKLLSKRLFEPVICCDYVICMNACSVAIQFQFLSNANES